MKAVEPQTGYRQRIEMRRCNLAAKGTEIGKAEIVGDDDQLGRPLPARLARLRS
jgi:hypothetical protein